MFPVSLNVEGPVATGVIDSRMLVKVEYSLFIVCCLLRCCVGRQRPQRQFQRWVTTITPFQLWITCKISYLFNIEEWWHYLSSGSYIIHVNVIRGSTCVVFVIEKGQSESPRLSNSSPTHVINSLQCPNQRRSSHSIRTALFFAQSQWQTPRARRFSPIRHRSRPPFSSTMRTSHRLRVPG